MNEAQHPPSTVRFANFEVDLRSGELRKAGVKIKLQEQPFKVLQALLEHPGEVVSREDLRKRIWPEESFGDFDHAVNIAVGKLRAALNDSAETPRLVETLHRRGYRFIGSLDPSSLPTLQPATAQTQISLAPPPLAGSSALSGRFYRRILVTVLVLAAASIILFAFDLGGLRKSLFAKPAVARIQSVVVLPLENLSNDPEQEYFADGMTDDLITNLSQISALRVISRTSAMQYKKTKKPLPEIARTLGVDGVIEGSVIRAGNRVRINAQLLDARTDSHVWARSYERNLRDVLAMQDEVIHDIVSEIRAKVTAQEQERLTTAQPVNPEAYVSYLKGCYFWNRRTEEGARMAVENLQAAIEKDPAYAPAYTALALSYTADAIFGWLPPSQVIPKAKAAALKSLEIDSRFGEAHATLGIISFQYEWDWSTAERHFERAVALSPTSVNVHFFYSLYLSALGRTVEADAAAKRQLDLDPVSPVAVYQRGLQVYRTRRFDEAINQGKASLTLDPNFPLGHWLLGEAYIGKGMYREAATEYGKYVELSRGSSRALGYLGYAHGRSGDRRKALQVLNQLRNLTRQHYVSPFYFALVYAGLGDRDQAFLWLGKAFDEHCGHIVFLNVEAEWDSLREDPRFADMMRRARLVP